MNFKKLAITAVAGALMLSSTIPAFASDHHRSPSPEVKTTINSWADLDTDIVTVAKTGDNEISGQNSHHHRTTIGGAIYTGVADSYSEVSLNVNPTSVSTSCDCLPKKGEVTTCIGNGADVDTDVVTVAKTGDNEISNGGGTITSGNALAGSIVTGTVNSTVVSL